MCKEEGSIYSLDTINNKALVQKLMRNPTLCVLWPASLPYKVWVCWFIYGTSSRLICKEASMGKEIEAWAFKRSFAWATNIWTTCGEELGTYISLSNPFFWLFFSHISCLLSVFEQRICTCVIHLSHSLFCFVS